VADKLKVDSSIVYSNIAEHGNTSSASIPIRRRRDVGRGSDEVVRKLSAFSNQLSAFCALRGRQRLTSAVYETADAVS
jgi:3-oxoacyl-[acyl-carrier-protein] synthase III